jgi:hypothetical protein
MERVKSDRTILDSGAGVCAVCADDTETEVKIGSKVGIVALVILGFAIGIAVTPLNRTTPFVEAALLLP